MAFLRKLAVELEVEVEVEEGALPRRIALPTLHEIEKLHYTKYAAILNPILLPGLAPGVLLHPSVLSQNWVWLNYGTSACIALSLLRNLADAMQGFEKLGAPS